MTLIYLSAGLFLAGLILIACSNIHVYFLRKRGVYPTKGNMNKNEIKEFLKEGRRVLAIRAYREWCNCSLKEAKNVIDKMKI